MVKLTTDDFTFFNPKDEKYKNIKQFRGACLIEKSNQNF